jgi:DNA-directed RNA polymerase specialized sigma24 family protein
MEEERLWLFGEIRQMKRDDQELMILTLYSGLNDTEIASQLGITPDNLRVRRHRIITRLKNRAADRRTEE